MPTRLPPCGDDSHLPDPSPGAPVGRRAWSRRWLWSVLTRGVASGGIQVSPRSGIIDLAQSRADSDPLVIDGYPESFRWVIGHAGQPLGELVPRRLFGASMSYGWAVPIQDVAARDIAAGDVVRVDDPQAQRVERAVHDDCWVGAGADRAGRRDRSDVPAPRPGLADDGRVVAPRRDRLFRLCA